MKVRREVMVMLVFLLSTVVASTWTFAQEGASVRVNEAARLRTGPSTMTGVAATVPSGTLLPALGTNPERNWIQVSYNGDIGWIFADLLRFESGNLNQLPILDVTSAPTQPTPSLEIGGTVAPTVDLRLRYGPGVSYTSVGYVPADTQLSVLAVSEDQGWVQVSFNGVIGWLSRTYLRTISGATTSVTITPQITEGLTSTPAPLGTTFNVYTDAVDYNFFPSGYIGDTGDITINELWTEDPHSGDYTIRVEYHPLGRGPYGCAYNPPCRWAGVYWQTPPNNWGTVPAVGHNLTGFRRLTFWARADSRVWVEFKVGGITGPYPDSLRPARSVGLVALTTEWQQFTIDLTGEDLSYVIGGFLWSTNWQYNQIIPSNPRRLIFYLDDIVFEQ